jgi:copper(I)-binding protein
MKTPQRAAKALAAAAALSLVVTACGNDTKTADGTTTTAASSKVTVANGWARNSPMAATAGAAYVEITGGSMDDELLSAAAPSTVAGRTEIHETVMADTSTSTAMSGDMTTTTMAMSDDMTTTTMAMSDDMTTTTMAMSGSGMGGDAPMEMRPVSSLAIPKGKTVMMKPGGYHVMLLDLVKPLELGSTFELELTFKEAGKVTTKITVKDAP